MRFRRYMVGNRRKGEERFVGVSRADTSRAIETERRIVNYAAARHPVQLLFPFSSILERSSSSVCARYARWKGKKGKGGKGGAEDLRGGRRLSSTLNFLGIHVPFSHCVCRPPFPTIQFLMIRSLRTRDITPLRSCSISSLSISSDRFRVQYFLKMEKGRFSRGRDRRVEVGWI